MMAIHVVNGEWSLVNGRTRVPFAIRYSPIALLLPFLLSACGSSNDQAQQSGPPPAMAVQVHVLQGHALGNAFTTTGSLLPNEEVELRSEVSGRVT
ncbi:MAG: hypothetical protein KF797_12890, partial [Flavobacteriales bacterium]|nr:hypothetical protein [Flavobacteriales bacterium]